MPGEVLAGRALPAIATVSRLLSPYATNPAHLLQAEGVAGDGGDSGPITPVVARCAGLCCSRDVHRPPHTRGQHDEKAQDRSCARNGFERAGFTSRARW